ncbi:hypothetical protein ARNL5_00875 [Anaerolineae bacterium]|nr:hypothetical protein ARNL5_00875 [Anaerolineae bacterium]
MREGQSPTVGFLKVEQFRKRMRDRLKRVGFMQIEPICPLFIERGSLRGKLSCPLTLTPKESGNIVLILMIRFGATTSYQSV